MKRVLVTGATGFIGRHTLDPLLERGFEVHALYTHEPLQDTRVTWHKADLLDEHTAQQLCKTVHPTHLLHFAWYVNPKDYKTSEENRRWVDATTQLLRAFAENGGTRATLAGTCMEYDWTVPQELVAESSPIKPATLYGQCKNETWHRAQYVDQKLSIGWGRIFHLYGPHEALPRLVPAVIQALLKNEEARTSSGEQLRDYSYVKDVAEAFCALLESAVTGPVNIASGVPVQLKDIIVTIADIIGKHELVRLGAIPTSPSEPARLVASVGRLREEVGFIPRYDLLTGLKETIAWWHTKSRRDDDT